MEYFFQQTINSENNIDWTQMSELEQCEIVNLQLNNFDLNTFKFIDCTFINCDLSLARLAETVFNEVKFENCKLMGLHWEHASSFTFSVSFLNSNLSQCSFFKVNISSSKFESCLLEDVDFTDANLSKSALSDCNLLNAHFENTDLQQADLSTAFNFSINPNQNKVKGAIFGNSNISGLLDVFKIKIV